MKRFLFTLLLIASVLIPAINANAMSSRWLAVLMGEKVSGVFLDDVIDSVVCDLDATISASYSGSGQTWANLIASPADGANQIDYDAHLGADDSSSTDDPTFTGSAGDDAAFFNVDGGDWFTFKTIANATTLIKAHRSDTSGTWIAIAFRTSGIPVGFTDFWGNSLGSDRGVGGQYDSTGNNIRLRTFGDTAGVQAITNGTALSGDTDYLIILSWDGTSTSNNGVEWVNSATATTTESSTFNTSTTDETGIFNIGSSNNGSRPLPSGSRIYHFSCGNEFLDDTKAAAIRTHLQERHAGMRY